MLSASPSLVTPDSEFLFHGLYRHCHYRVPFYFSSCPALSLSGWDVSQILVHTSLQSLPSSCILSIVAAAFQTRRFKDTQTELTPCQPSLSLISVVTVDSWCITLLSLYLSHIPNKVK